MVELLAVDESTMDTNKEHQQDDQQNRRDKANSFDKNKSHFLICRIVRHNIARSTRSTTRSARYASSARSARYAYWRWSARSTRSTRCPPPRIEQRKHYWTRWRRNRQ